MICWQGVNHELKLQSVCKAEAFIFCARSLLLILLKDRSWVLRFLVLVDTHCLLNGLVTIAYIYGGIFYVSGTLLGA